jgi:6-phosphofructokinase 1
MDIAAKLGERGARVVGVPKTIDNDLAATDTTCGYPTAVEVVTQALDRLHTTAESHDRVMLCEVMGRYAGWIALESGLASGADIILIPEIPYRLERLAGAIEARKRQGITYSLVVVAEGARREGGGLAVARPGDSTRLEKLGGAADRLAAELVSCLGEVDVRVTVLGHVQRGGTPTALDRLLATRYGTVAVDLIAAGDFGRMVVQRGRDIASVPLAEVRRGPKLVDPEGELVRTARAMGVELGA